MSIEDPNIADILKPMDWFKNTPAETIPIKSAKERFDEYMRSQDLSYLVPKPEKKAWFENENISLFFFFVIFVRLSLSLNNII